MHKPTHLWCAFGHTTLARPQRFRLQYQPMKVIIGIIFAVVATNAMASSTSSEFDIKAAERFAQLALACVHKEYPNHISHTLNSDADVAAPRSLTPAFYGCYDWHSSVHGHWLLVRLIRTFPQADFVQTAREALRQSLTGENIAQEAAYLRGKGRSSFERPYGLAWLMQLAAELNEWDDPQAKQMAANLRPLVRVATERLNDWLPKLANPVRIGEHDQTAFALGLLLDYARGANDGKFAALVVSRARHFYLNDRNCPLAYEPDPSDPKLAHLDGLNLSRAWMLEGIAAGLPRSDKRLSTILATAEAHSRAGLAAVTGEHYEGGHWLGSYAVYLVTRRGISNN